MQDLLVGRDRHRFGRVDHMLDVGLPDLPIAYGDHTVRVEAADMTARDAGVDRVDLAAGHQFGFLDRTLDRLRGRLDVHHHAALEAARRLGTDADELDAAVFGDLADQRHHFRGPDIESDDQLSVRLACHVFRQPSGVPSSSSIAATRVPLRQPVAKPFE